MSVLMGTMGVDAPAPQIINEEDPATLPDWSWKMLIYNEHNTGSCAVYLEIPDVLLNNHEPNGFDGLVVSAISGMIECERVGQLYHNIDILHSACSGWRYHIRCIKPHLCQYAMIWTRSQANRPRIPMLMYDGICGSLLRRVDADWATEMFKHSPENLIIFCLQNTLAVGVTQVTIHIPKGNKFNRSMFKQWNNHIWYTDIYRVTSRNMVEFRDFIAKYAVGHRVTITNYDNTNNSYISSVDDNGKLRDIPAAIAQHLDMLLQPYQIAMLTAGEPADEDSLTYNDLPGPP